MRDNERMNVVTEAFKNLEMPEYSAIKAVFGKVLQKRSTHNESRCSLFNLLALRADPLRRLNEDCSIYIDEIGPEDAQRKCNADVLGNAKRPFVEFNGSCGDFWAEIAAIRVLSGAGYSQFRAIHRELPDGTTSDYEACRGGAAAYIEVKNIRPNKTVLDAFDKELRRLYDAEPTQFAFSVEVEFPYDTPPTPEQERRIVGFLESIRGLQPPLGRELDLVDSLAQITIRTGEGTVLMTRGVGPKSPEPIGKEWFLSKVRAKAEEAASQMRNVNRIKVLVINFDSPSGSLSLDFIHSAQEVMREAFNRAVDPYFLLYRYLPTM